MATGEVAYVDRDVDVGGGDAGRVTGGVVPAQPTAQAAQDRPSKDEGDAELVRRVPEGEICGPARAVGPVRWLHEAGHMTHAYLVADMADKPDRLTAVCGRPTVAVYLVNIPFAPFCERCVGRININSARSEGYS